MKKDACISEDKLYRYMLYRIWDEKKPIISFIGLNPSTADDKIDDATIKKCINYTKNWGYGGFYMLNLFAFRTKSPYDIMESTNPIGLENDEYIEKYIKLSDKVICAWGNHGKFNNRSKEVLSGIENKYYLKINKSGEPAHPLYLKNSLIPIRY